MKLPVIRQLYQTQTTEKLEKTLEVLEAFSEFRGTTEEDLNVAGELITNICGALEVHANVANGMAERDALNSFAQKVLGSIDK
jgi:CMP-N-acetylneuraminic acid synthetase